MTSEDHIIKTEDTKKTIEDTEDTHTIKTSSDDEKNDIEEAPKAAKFRYSLSIRVRVHFEYFGPT